MPPREMRRADWPAVLALNLASVQQLSPMDEPRLQSILELADRGLVIDRAGEVLAFAIAIAPASAYDSENYRWFATRFERFLYLDRVAVAEQWRRHGLGAQLYDAMELAAAPYERMVCEVNVLPPNHASLAFHRSRGYVEIGRLEHGAEKVVALLGKELAEPASS